MIWIILAVILTFSGVYFLSQNRKVDCSTDLNQDGSIGMGDLTLLLSKYGTACEDCPEDLNSDGMIDSLDQSILLKHYGKPCSNPI